MTRPAHVERVFSSLHYELAFFSSALVKGCSSVTIGIAFSG
jgi:hypothetical protein